MSVEINLLQNKKDYNKLENAFKIARIAVVIIGATCFIFLFVIFALKTSIQSSVHEAADNRDALQTEINNLQESEARIMLIKGKVDGIDDTLREYPDYATRLETLVSFLPVSSESGRLQNIFLDQENASMVLAFNGILPLSEFLSVAESDIFRDTFNSVQLGGLSIKDPNNQVILNVDVTFKKN